MSTGSRTHRLPRRRHQHRALIDAANAVETELAAGRFESPNAQCIALRGRLQRHFKHDEKLLHTAGFGRIGGAPAVRCAPNHAAPGFGILDVKPARKSQAFAASAREILRMRILQAAWKSLPRRRFQGSSQTTMWTHRGASGKHVRAWFNDHARSLPRSK